MRPVRGRPRLVAAGFLFAFALSILTVVLTGLWVRSPEARRERMDRPPAARVEAEQRSSAERAAAADADQGRSADGLGGRPQ